MIKLEVPHVHSDGPQALDARDHGLAYYDAQIRASTRLNQIQIVFSEGRVLE